MAAKGKATGGAIETPKRTRPGIHSKNNSSSQKRSKNYKKKYRGQGGKR
jgi:hypothetical protein